MNDQAYLRSAWCTVKTQSSYSVLSSATSMTPLLDLSEMARILGRSPHTIKRDLRRNPDAVPPRLLLPGTKLLRWRPQDVDAWLASHVVHTPCRDGARL